MLYNLISHSDEEYFEHHVISLIGGGVFEDRIKANEIPVHSLGMEPGVPNPFAIVQLSRLIRAKRPDAIQTWLYHADLVGGLAAALAGNGPVVWGIRYSDLDRRVEKRTTVWTAKACAVLSPWLPERIVCVSESARVEHAKLGYVGSKMVVITNGFDTDVFMPNPAARREVRQELGINSSANLIGLIARYHPQKGHAEFLEAAANFVLESPRTHFLMCGEGVTAQNSELIASINAKGLGENCHLLGERQDIPRLTASLDIATIAAVSGEGFPAVVGEAMACGVPRVVTDVGDSATLVGETGVVVPPRDSRFLAEGWRAMLLGLSKRERARLGAEGRQQIMKKYEIRAIVRQYAGLYEAVVQSNGAVNDESPSLLEYKLPQD